ncbi:MAG: hypothetical protein RM049_38425 [Nostoc sp. DedQUE04]|uniref:hypothetical protein n=1 Tax=Nostoc sp. DedQUE04 TaxID=3075390 RepID=UPI002AD21E5A|nr:hypothetical protein [Nostoc sp. DedQUE04]MDZ8141098.1 hypothetical protein [Nostoc sp. DedQUE04]
MTRNLLTIPQTFTQVEDPLVLRWKGLHLKLRFRLDSAGQFYSELVSQVSEAVGVANGEPYWNGYLGQWLFFGLQLFSGN